MDQRDFNALSPAQRTAVAAQNKREFTARCACAPAWHTHISSNLVDKDCCASVFFLLQPRRRHGHMHAFIRDSTLPLRI